MKGHNAGLEALRVKIAVCTRVMNMEGLIDYSGHVSARLPDNSGILIQSFDDSRAALEPDDRWFRSRTMPRGGWTEFRYIPTRGISTRWRPGRRLWRRLAIATRR